MLNKIVNPYDDLMTTYDDYDDLENSYINLKSYTGCKFPLIHYNNTRVIYKDKSFNFDTNHIKYNDLESLKKNLEEHEYNYSLDTIKELMIISDVIT